MRKQIILYRRRCACLLPAILLLLMICVAPPGFAQESGEVEELKEMLRQTQASMAQMMAEHQRQMDELQTRIEELEQKSKKVEREQESVAEELLELAAGEQRSGLLGNLSLHGYYDIQYLNADNTAVGSFVQNELSIFLRSSTEDERWIFFSEIEFELLDGDEFFYTDADRTSDLEIETAWVEYRHADYLRVRAGKHLLPQYWQTYHYPNLTLSTRAPAMVGTIFPRNIIGLELRGDIWFAGDRGLSYALYAGNGGDSEISEIDRNDNTAVGGRLTMHLAKGGRLKTLDISVSGYNGRDHDNSSNAVFGIDTQIRIGKFEFMSEYARGNQYVRIPAPRTRPFPRQRLLSVKSDTEGYYAQFAYNVKSKWHTFYRFDELDLFDEGAGMFDAHQHTLGANFRPRPNISLKLELFRVLLDGDRDDFNGVASSLVYNF